MTRIWRPSGWGVGVPLLDAPGKPVHYDRVDVVRERLRPAWMQTWTICDLPGVAPAWEFATGELSLEEFAAINGKTALILNEPETGRVGPLSPHDAAVRTCNAVEYLSNANVRFNWAAPNSNINGANLDWLAEYATALVSMGYLPTLWAIHIYGNKIEQVQHHWQRFLRWYKDAGERRPVLVTEGGAVANASSEEHLAMMGWLHTIMDNDPVVGVAYFASHSYVEGRRRYTGLLADPAMEEQWTRLRDIRR